MDAEYGELGSYGVDSENVPVLLSEPYTSSVDICKNLNANEYISTIGSKDYLENHKNLFTNEKILLTYHKYKHPKYNQLFEPFLEYACILDLILNEGQKSHDIIRSGRF